MEQAVQAVDLAWHWCLWTYYLACWQISYSTFWCMSLLCYCFWPSLRASSICFVSSFSHGICIQYSDCSVLMTLFSRILVLLFPFLRPCISLQLGVVSTFTKLFSTELLGSLWPLWQVLGIGGGGGGRAHGWVSGRRKGRLWCAPQTCLQGIQPPLATLALPIKL